MDRTTSIQELKDLVAEFVDERDWRQFHSPKNLSMSIAIEAAELMEIFQWPDAGEPLDRRQRDKLHEELADVVIYCLSLANATGTDLSAAVRDKVARNAAKYPADKFRGKYR